MTILFVVLNLMRLSPKKKHCDYENQLYFREKPNHLITKITSGLYVKNYFIDPLNSPAALQPLITNHRKNVSPIDI